MAFKRRFTNYVSTAANTSDQYFNASYNDSYRTIHIKTLYCGTIVSGFAVGIRVNGFEYARIDTTRFANGNPHVEVEVEVPANARVQFVTNDQAGSAHATTPIVVGYEVDYDQ